MQDIFDFWADVPGDAKMHPEDAPILDRSSHGFNLQCLPSNVHGPLRTARVVLLYLSPGLHPRDLEDAADPEAQRHYQERRNGLLPLLGPEDHPSGHAWWAARTKHFGTWQELQNKVAFLNIGAYHSTAFDDWAMLTALPSCRASVAWAQSVLFKQAEAGERVVICMRSAAFWGLGKVSRYGLGLFAPKVNRGGHMLKDGDDMTSRAEVIEAAKAALAKPPLPAFTT